MGGWDDLVEDTLKRRRFHASMLYVKYSFCLGCDGINQHKLSSFGGAGNADVASTCHGKGRRRDWMFYSTATQENHLHPPYSDSDLDSRDR